METVKKLEKLGFIKYVCIPNCIYALCRRGKCVYIGQTTNFEGRINHHASSLKIFDTIYFLPTDAHNLNSVEQYFITEFNPKYNEKQY